MRLRLQLRVPAPAGCAHPSRFAPHVGMLMYALAIPSELLDGAGDERARRVVWALAATLQLILVQRIVSRWMFSSDGHLENARAPYLLSTVGWFLLGLLGLEARVIEAWQLHLPVLCVGAGCFFYLATVLSILQVRLRMDTDCH